MYAQTYRMPLTAILGDLAVDETVKPPITHSLEVALDPGDGAYVYQLRPVREQPELLSRWSGIANAIPAGHAHAFREWLAARGHHVDRRWCLIGLTGDEAIEFRVRWSGVGA